MIVVEEARRELEELTDEQFVRAVIRVHESVISGLRALADGLPVTSRRCLPPSRSDSLRRKSSVGSKGNTRAPQ
ncbi:MAG TPA: hypothetical protein VK881_04140 [bacterium]|nr:hypothetical protein [bacterium]